MIRRAAEKDLEQILNLLHQVLEVHAKLRPDLFIPGTTKYSPEELKELMRDDQKPIFVWTDEDDVTRGYAFCVIQEPVISENMVPHRGLYIDDLCVDETCRGRHIGADLFDFVKEEAKRRGCYHLTLNVWDGNSSALAFYQKRGLKTQKTVMEMILDPKSK
ncbi:MAG: GNAT family N-acetyltransferase [Solobacterium sp.]|nr:GNAT family N-acetyltransferase [Solobacterium sp.]